MGWAAGRLGGVHCLEEGRRKKEALTRPHHSSALCPLLLCLAGVFHPIPDANMVPQWDRRLVPMEEAFLGPWGCKSGVRWPLFASQLFYILASQRFYVLAS